MESPNLMESPEHYPNLTVGHLFGESWPIFKENLGLTIGIVLINMVVAALSDEVWFLTLLITGPLTAGSYWVFLRLVRGQDAEISQLLEGFKEFGRSIGVYLLMMLAIAVGLVLLIVPGFVLMVGLMPAMFLVLDGEAGVVDTLKEAYEMTRGYKWQLFVVGLALVLVNIVGLLLLVVGVLFSIGLSYIVLAAAYNELAGRPDLYGESPGAEIDEQE